MPKDCPPGKILNPETGRCVNVDGAIGRKLAKGGGGEKPVVMSGRVYVDNAQNRKLGRVGLPIGSVPSAGPKAESPKRASSPRQSSVPRYPPPPVPRVYADNAQNRKLGRVGRPIGEATAHKADNRGCTDQSHTKKYAERPSPAYPANQCCGENKVGNDGNMWTSVADKRGICRWVRTK